MNRQPTEEQIKEFWEWCGIKQDSDRSWRDADGIGVLVSTVMPDIDLNNLFRYAVPKLIDKYGGVLFVLPQSDILSWECRILNKPGDEATFGCNKDPALALFWAIWDVIKSEVKP